MDTLQNAALALMLFSFVLEAVLSAVQHLHLYDSKDSAVNILLGAFTISISLAMKGLTLNLFVGIQDFAITRMDTSWITAVALFFISDLYYYSFHRLAHNCRFVWASHVVHHSSEKFNLTVAIRLPFTNGFYRFLFWTPLCLLGFPPVLVILMDTLVVYYTFFIHTETVDRLGWLEKVLNTPSHHRVHHSTNAEYLDKNFGGVLILWDKLFGTFAGEEARPRYGITKPFRTYNPVKIVCDEWVCMYRQLKESRTLGEMLKTVFGHPAWKPPRNASKPTTPRPFAGSIGAAQSGIPAD